MPRLPKKLPLLVLGFGLATAQLFSQKAPGPAVLAKGKAIYSAVCVACHQANGKGVPGAFPPLVGSEWLAGNPERAIAIVLKGMSGPAEVSGQTYNNIMTPQEAALKDEDIAAVLTYVMAGPDFGHKLAPVSPAQVKATREKVKGKTGMWTAEEILKLYPLGKAGSGPKLADLKYSLYLGNWSKMPDFSTLKPQNEGTFADNVIRTQFGEMKNNFGVVYTAKLTVPKDGDYTFYLTSDDGGILYIDGKKLIDNDGIHPSGAVKEAKVKLKAGQVSYRLEYFQGGGQIELFSAWSGPGFGPTVFSKWVPEGWDGKGGRKKATAPSIPLLVSNEAVIYRNFVTKSGGRPIAVGYPGGFNLTWSADQFNLGLIWRGSFIDAGQHWTDRGGGETSPTGEDALRTTVDVQRPFAVLTSPTDPWPKSDKKNRPEGYTWKGYSLDDKRFPTFFYEWGKVSVSERFDVSGEAANGGRLTRTIRLKGELPANAYLRLVEGDVKSEGGVYEASSGRFDMQGRNFDNTYRLAVEGAQIVGRTLLVPVRPEIVVHYTWSAPNTEAVPATPAK